jgi:hypothetical protein
METIFGDGSDNNLVCLANSKRWKRVLTGESLFMTAFINPSKESIFASILEKSSYRFNRISRQIHLSKVRFM